MITMQQKHEMELRDAARAAYAEGYAEEYKKGTEMACKLTKLLLDAGRMDDLRRMCDDKAYFDELRMEFGLSYDDE